jgi:eukaryotic-like serine/threonine-protein kinase
MKCNTCGNDNLDGARFCASCGAVLAAAAAPGTSLVGQVVGGRFAVKRVLGEGGMGVVYEAEQQMGSATRKVALKTLHAHLSHDPSVSQRFHRECGTIAQLEHPNTIKVYDFGATADGTLYIAMEFVAGEALSQVIEKSGAMPIERVLKILRQIAGSLDEAHAQGVIHRDLKPDNVVLTQRAGEKDVVKLLDFGIAARTESADAQREQKLTQQGMVLGTPPYMSPEQFTGKALDARSDIYSLGVMAYEMLTGRLPFDATTPWQWATEHMMSQPIPFEATPVASQIPESTRAAILRSLAKNRDERQSSAAQFCDELAGTVPVPQVSAPVAASTGTAAMAAPPAFAAGPANGTAKTAAMPQAAPSSPVAPVAAAPVLSGGGKSGGGKGLVFGLAGVGGVLLIGIIVVATRSSKPAQEEPLSSPFASASAAPAKIAPVVENPPEVAPTPSSEPPEPEPTKAVATGTPAVQKQPRPSSGERPGGSTTTKPPPGPGGCAGCISAASAGNYPGAASAYNSCSDAAQKAQCAGIVRGRAPEAAQTAAFNGSCGQAKAIAAAGQAMGMNAKAFAKALAACK